MAASALRTLALGTYLGLAPRGRLATPAPLRWPNKDPGETLDYSLDLTAVLADLGGDTIVFAVPAVTPVGLGALTVNSQQIASPLITLTMGQGVVNQDYQVSITVTLASGKVLRPVASLFVGPVLATAGQDC